MKTYRVIVRKEVIWSTVVTVKANSVQEACDKALSQAPEREFTQDDVTYDAEVED